MYRFLKRIVKILPPRMLFALEPALRSIIAACYSGSKVQCPVCTGNFRKFIRLAGEQGSGLLCPKCGSIQRKRLLWLFLENEMGIGEKEMKTLHFSPGRGVARRMKKLKNLDYASTDFESDLCDKQHDITAIDEPDNSFGLVIASHVLEHIPDDRKAMAELFRILRPGGTAILQVPFREGETLEDISITDPAKRKELFGQEDHVRHYGREDFAQRLRTAGFEVEVRHYAKELGKEPVGKYALNEEEVVFACTRQG